MAITLPCGGRYRLPESSLANTLVLCKARLWKDALKLICTALVQKVASQLFTVEDIMAKPISHFGVDSLVTVEVIKQTMIAMDRTLSIPEILGIIH
jgi:hypothetical protein